MVELLAVLGIMGVLSVAGVSGYNHVVSNHRAHELRNKAIERAMAISHQLAVGKVPSLSAFTSVNKIAGGTFEAVVEELDSNRFAIKINGVDKNVCSALIKSLSEHSLLQEVADYNTYDTLTTDQCQNGSNNLALVFDTFLMDKNTSFNNSVEQENESGSGTESGESSSGGTESETTGTQTEDPLSDPAENQKETDTCPAGYSLDYNDVCCPDASLDRQNICCPETGWFDSNNNCCPNSSACTQECAADQHCSGNFVCVDHACVCPEGTVEDTETNSCVKCTANNHCATNHVCVNNACVCPAGTVENTETNSCVECTANNHCATNHICVSNACSCPEGTVEDTETNSCVECTANNHCTTNHVCVNNACTCPTNTIEDSATNTCVECVTSTDCSNGQVCANNTCVDCATDDHCSTNHICLNNECICPSNMVEDPATNTCVECVSSTDCSNGYLCLNHACVACAADTDCANNHVCVNNACTCPTDTVEDPATNTCVECVTNDNCITNHICVNNACVCPENSVENATTHICVECTKDSQCGTNYVCENNLCTCPNKYFKTKDKQCILCTDLYRYEATADECGLCGSERIFVTEGSKTYCDWDCPIGWFRNKNRNCTNCGNIQAKETSQEECNKCKQNTIFKRELQSGNMCALPSGCPEGSFKGTNENGTICYICSDPGTYKAEKTECDKCSGREFSNNYCLLSCETGYFRSSADNKCYPCSEQTAYKSLKVECDRCSGRKLYNGYCILKGYCPDSDTFWNTTDETCSSCSDELYAKKSSAEACAGCGTKRFYGTRDGIGQAGYCNPECPSGWFQNKNGNCTDCANSAQKETTETECNKCKGTAFTRKMGGTGNKYCTMPGGCPAGYFKGSGDSICRLCTDTIPYKAAEADCNRCVDQDGNAIRQWISNMCSKKEN